MNEASSRNCCGASAPSSTDFRVPEALRARFCRDWTGAAREAMADTARADTARADTARADTAQDDARAERLRRMLHQGVFLPWLELGRAPTPSEIAHRLGASLGDTHRLLDDLEACGQQIPFGILRVPQSEILAVAWPFANVPTGITVTVEDSKPVYARCAIDALGISKMLGKKATITAPMRGDDRPFHAIIDGEHVVLASPPDACVVHTASCDDIFFVASKEAGERLAGPLGEGARVFSLVEAVHHGAEFFGAFTEGFSR